MLEKAAASGADEVVLDLEDAVAPAAKDEARAAVATALGSLDFGEKLVAVRVNAVPTSFCFRDIVEVAAAGGADAIVLPKVDAPSHVNFATHLLDGLGASSVRLELLIESASGATNVAAIAAASPRADALLFGPGDYAASMGVVQLSIGDPAGAREAWAWAMGSIAAHARAAGLAAIDGPYADIRDREGFIESARRAAALGFEGKWCIHPDQVPWANEVFTPTDEQVAEAQAILAAWREAADDARGAAAFDGRMIDEASRRMAESVVARRR
jgi:citrate lyase subunit beta/citryl-CoA lyase